MFGSIRYTDRLKDAGMHPSALLEIHTTTWPSPWTEVPSEGPWKDLRAPRSTGSTRFNTKRILQPLGDIYPADFETCTVNNNQWLRDAAYLNKRASGKTGAIHLGLGLDGEAREASQVERR